MTLFLLRSKTPFQMPCARCNCVPTLEAGVQMDSPPSPPSTVAARPAGRGLCEKKLRVVVRSFRQHGNALQASSTSIMLAPQLSTSKSSKSATGRLAPRKRRRDTAPSAHSHPRRPPAIRHAAPCCLSRKKLQNWPEPRSYEGTYEERPAPQTPELMKELMNFITSASLLVWRSLLCSTRCSAVHGCDAGTPVPCTSPQQMRASLDRVVDRMGVVV